MRRRTDVVSSLEAVYKEAYDKASEAPDGKEMDALDFGFQRDQVFLEVLLDIRDAMAKLRHAAQDRGSGDSGILDKAKALHKFTSIRPR